MAATTPTKTTQAPISPLRQRMLDALQLRGMAPRTQETYIDAVARLARHYRGIGLSNALFPAGKARKSPPSSS